MLPGAVRFLVPRNPFLGISAGFLHPLQAPWRSTPACPEFVACQNVFDNPGNFIEADAAFQKCRHRDFVRRVQGHGLCAPPASAAS